MAIDGYVIDIRIGLRTKGGDHLAIDRNTPR
jgi:hypothetical protein